MDDIRSAVTQALQSQGAEILAVPSRFVGSVSDLADTDLPEMKVLTRCCDARWLEPFAQAVETRSASDLATASAMGCDRLASTYLIDGAVAQALSRQTALGIADYLGIEAPAELSDTPGAPADGAMASPVVPSAETQAAPQVPQPQGEPSATSGWSQGAIPAPAAQTPAPAAPRRKKNTTLAIALAAALAAGGGAFVLTQHPEWVGLPSANASVNKRYVIRANVTAPGLNENGSRIPVHVVGTTIGGDELDEYGYIDSQGYGLELPAGTYQGTIVTSPIGEGGTLYKPENPTFDLDIPAPDTGDEGWVKEPMPEQPSEGSSPAAPDDSSSDVPDDFMSANPVDVSPPTPVEGSSGSDWSVRDDGPYYIVSGPGIVLIELPSEEVTQELLDEVYEWARKDNKMQDRIDELVDITQKHHDEYVKQKQAEEDERKRLEEEERKRKQAEEDERKRQEEAERLYAATHYDCEYFSVAVPESWVDNWSVEYSDFTDGDGMLNRQWVFTESGGGYAHIWFRPGNGYPATWEFLGTAYYSGSDGSIPNAFLLRDDGFFGAGATLTPYTV